MHSGWGCRCTLRLRTLPHRDRHHWGREDGGLVLRRARYELSQARPGLGERYFYSVVSVMSIEDSKPTKPFGRNRGVERDPWRDLTSAEPGIQSPAHPRSYPKARSAKIAQTPSGFCVELPRKALRQAGDVSQLGPSVEVDFLPLHKDLARGGTYHHCSAPPRRHQHFFPEALDCARPAEKVHLTRDPDRVCPLRNHTTDSLLSNKKQHQHQLPAFRIRRASCP